MEECVRPDGEDVVKSALADITLGVHQFTNKLYAPK